jgi:hypothetical protein
MFFSTRQCRLLSMTWLKRRRVYLHLSTVPNILNVWSGVSVIVRPVPFGHFTRMGMTWYDSHKAPNGNTFSLYNLTILPF